MSAAVTLVGADLDLAVAFAGEEWKTAHQLFPTMTLDPKFSGVRMVEFGDGTRVCHLIPRNSMRQDPQAFCPSDDWELGGRIIEREKIAVYFEKDGYPGPCWVAGFDLTIDEGFGGSEVTGADRPELELQHSQQGPTPLIAAMRAFVSRAVLKAAGEQE